MSAMSGPRMRIRLRTQQAATAGEASKRRLVRRDAVSCFFFSSRRRHTRLQGDWSSDVCSSDLRRVGQFLRSCGCISTVTRPRRAHGGPPHRPVKIATRAAGTAHIAAGSRRVPRSEEHTSELQSPCNLVCRLLLEKKKNAKDAILVLQLNHPLQCYLISPIPPSRGSLLRPILRATHPQSLPQIFCCPNAVPITRYY